MSKTWKIVISCVAVALVALTVTLLCVFLIDRKPYKVTGEGTVEMTQTENGETMLTAKPDKWQSFAGWYVVDEETGELSKSPVSTESVMVLGEDAPRYTAVFKASTLDALDRTLSGVYQKYSAGIEAEKDYFNFAGDIDLDVRVGDTSPLTLNVKAGGYFNFSGLGNEFYLSVTPQGNETVLFAIYYVDSVSEAKLYTNIAGEMNTYNFISLSQLVTEIPALSDHIWSIKNILYGAIDNPETVEKIYSVVEKFLGVANSQGVCGEAINSKNSSTFSLRLDVLLQTIEPLLGTLDINSEILDVLSEVIDGLTKEYTGTNFLPMIMLDFTVNYETAGDVEYVDSIGLNFSIDEDYNVNFGEVTTVEDMEISLNVKDIELGFAESKNGVDSAILELFPEAKNLLNVDIAGTLTFYTETVTDETTSVLNPTDVYDVSIQTDINVGALSNAISKNGFDYTKIDWENLGFLSISVTLDEEKSSVEAHTNDDGVVIKDYINIFMDTEKYGPTLYAYVGLYNPQMIAQVDLGFFKLPIEILKEYLFNSSFYLPELVNAVEIAKADKENTNNEEVSSQAVITNSTEQNQSVLQMIVSILKTLTDKESVMTNKVYNILSLILPAINNETVNSLLGDISYTDNNGILIGTKAIRTKIDDLLGIDNIEAPDIVNLDNVNLGNAVLGKTTTHLGLVIEEPKFGTVARNASEEGLGDYYGENKEKSLFELYNEKHITLVDVGNLKLDNKYIDSENAEIIFDKDNYKSELIGASITAEKAIMSDGQELEKIHNQSAGETSCTLIIMDVKEIEKTETYAKVQLVMRKSLTNSIGLIASYLGEDTPELLKGANGMDEVLYRLGIPGGVYVVTETIYFTSTESLVNLNLTASNTTNADFVINKPNVDFALSVDEDAFPAIKYQNGNFTDMFNQETTTDSYKNVGITFIPDKTVELSFSVMNNSESSDLNFSISNLVVNNINVSIKVNDEDYTLNDNIVIERGTEEQKYTANVVISFSLEDVAMLMDNSFSLDLNFAEAEVA